ncbi:hypothetical protein [Streptomyces hiroshimensis]|uniref:Uncharacterized protein n=1 Tax=Streptomyces hiroshimensis TaxID=66424 RepID=A0ABQ2Z823_9ACTN|nr:hypothetical protein [Streptomyces hiroshimensis]GGY07661.1 hypothetical protein GCM10010324_63090 [Streptomyces hiroshimensis]
MTALDYLIEAANAANRYIARSSEIDVTEYDDRESYTLAILDRLGDGPGVRRADGLPERGAGRPGHDHPQRQKTPGPLSRSPAPVRRKTPGSCGS